MDCAITNKSLTILENEFWARNKKDDTLKILMTHEELQFLERHVAYKMNQYFKDTEETVHLIALLTGAYYFIADLSKYLTFNYSIHFIKVTSYDNQKQKPCEFNKEELALFKSQKHVVLVDELIDTGASMRALREFLPNAMTCACLSKSQKADFIGCPFVPRLWLIGFGLDDESLRRGWIHLFCKNADQQKVIEFRKQLLELICQIQLSQEYEVKW